MKTSKFLLLLASLSLLTACQENTSKQESSTTSQVTATSSATDIKEDTSETINFSPDTKLLDLSESEKTDYYQKLDAIETLSGNQPTNSETYSQLLEIDNQADFEKIIEQSNQVPQLIYIGFTDCPFCKAFLPKLNQLCKELDLQFHYYDTDARQADPNFQDTIDNFFQVSTVPQLFLVKNEQAKMLDKTDSMQALEDLLKEATK